MPHLELKRWDNGVVIHSGEFASLSDLVQDAVRKDVSMYRARLDGARLDGARLDGARLVGASLVGARLDGASLDGARLVGARLDGARLDGARLVGARLDGARLVGASLDGARLVGASLDGASLDAIRADVWSVLLFAPNEIAGLRQKLVDGQVNGSMYEGECACLLGTIGNLRGCEYSKIPGVKPDSGRPAEKWFLAIQPGHKAETHPVVAITIGWIDEFFELMRAAAPVFAASN